MEQVFRYNLENGGAVVALTQLWLGSVIAYSILMWLFMVISWPIIKYTAHQLGYPIDRRINPVIHWLADKLIYSWLDPLLAPVLRPIARYILKHRRGVDHRLEILK